MEKITKEELLKAKIPGEETGIQVKTGFCGFCGGDCLLDFYIKDGKIIKTEGNCTLPGANGRVCVKGAAIKQALYNPDRILYPMKRVGKRGEGKFERISWEEALDTIAEKMQSVKSDKEDASSAQNALQCRRTAEMQQRLQHAAAHGQRLIRGGGAVGGLSPGVHIAAFHAGEYLQSRLQQSPEAAIDGADHGNTVYGGGDVSGPDQLSNFHAGCKDTCRRCPEYPLGAFAADLAGNAGVGQRTAAVQRSPQRVAPHGFHGGVAVNADGEAGADADDHRGVRDSSA